ncbi:hypothetical protein CPC08DRAFT_824753 [Agrocybe pediades]|nr:hypothetical protein CPC08DRAFT_824753 [Agrocybe pediades]
MPKSASQAVWTQADETTLISFLFEHRASAGDGASFKLKTFNDLVPKLEAMRTKGGPKDAKSCQNKWTMLRRIYRTIQDIQSQSGWTWDEKYGANITPVMEDQWALFLKSHPLAKPFKNHGWVHLEKVREIMPATLRGVNVFVPSQGTTGLMSSSGSPSFPEPIDMPETQLDMPEDPFEDSDPENRNNDEISASPKPAPRSSSPSHETGNSSSSVTLSSPLPVLKRGRSPSIPSTPRPKKAKTRNADRLESLTQSIANFGENICKVLAMDPTLRTPHRRQKAISLAQKEKWMSQDDRLLFCLCLETNIATADGYIALDRDDEEWCRAWIEARVNLAKNKSF